MKNNFRIKLLLLKASIIAATLLVASCNNSQPSSSSMTGLSKQDTINTGKDSQFLTKAAQINMEEIRLGELAQQNASMKEVKELGQMLEEDHRKSEDELAAIASKKSITLPTTPDDNSEADYKKLSGMSGSEFDKAYTDMMVNGHKDAISLFKSEASAANDTDIRKWAAATLPTLNKHLEQATACQAKCKNM